MIPPRPFVYRFCFPFSIRITAALAVVCLGLATTNVIFAEPAKEHPKNQKFSLGQATLGNVLLPEDNPAKISVHCDVQADEITWTLTDVWGFESPAERIPRQKAIADGLQIRLPYPGYFLLKARALDNKGATVATTEIAFAVLSSPPPTAKASPFGVVTHTGQKWNPDIFSLFRKAGLSIIRDGIDWTNVELKKGEFAVPKFYDEAMTVAQAEGMDVLHTLAFGNLLYDAPEGIEAWAAAPYTPSGFDGYTQYCLFLMKHFEKSAKYVEIWNEYNGGFARGPAAGQASVYTEMLKRSATAIRAKFPDATLVGCSTVGVPLTWIKEVFDHGGLDYMDTVSIHPYGYDEVPEAGVRKIEELKALIREYNKGKDKPIWVTEQGYYLMEQGSKGNREPITEMTKAIYLVRSWTLYLGLGVEKIFWYLGKNYDAFASMGLVGSETDELGQYAPKPSFCAYSTLVRKLDGYSFVRREETSVDSWSNLFARGSDQIRVMWATREQDVILDGAGSVTVTDIMGNANTLTPRGGKLYLHLTGMPLFVESTGSGTVRPTNSLLDTAGSVAMDEDLQLPFGGIPLPEEATLTTPWGKFSGKRSSTGVSFSLPPNHAPGVRWIPFVLNSKDGAIATGIAKFDVQAPIRLDQYARARDPKTLTIPVHVASRTEHPRFVEARLKIVGQPDYAPFKLETKASPQSTVEITLPVSNLVPFQVYPIEFTLVQDNGKKYDLKTNVSFNPVALSTNQSVDANGVLGEEINLDIAPYNKLQADRKGPNDVGGSIRVACDANYIYLTARITDDKHFQPYSGFNTWRGDNLQIGISTLAPWTGGEWENDHQEFSISLTESGPELFETTGSGGIVSNAKLTATRKDNVTTYRAAIPWSAIRDAKPPLKSFSLAVYVNDNDGTGRKGLLHWGNIKGLDSLQPCLIQSTPISKP